MPTPARIGSTSPTPRPSRAYGRGGAVPAVRHHVVVELVLDRLEVVAKCSSARTAGPTDAEAKSAREERVLVVRLQAVAGLELSRAASPSIPNQPCFGISVDAQVAPHREVDDRGRDVERVGLLVDERADLTRAQPVGGHELDGDRVVAADGARSSCRRSRLPNTTSAADPRKRRSRPTCGRQQGERRATAAPSRPPAGTSVFGRAAKRPPERPALLEDGLWGRRRSHRAGSRPPRSARVGREVGRC